MMELETAIQLIIKGIAPTDRPQVWADLGAGSGLFSRALSSILPAESTIHAIDRNYTTGQEIAPEKNSKKIVLSKKDFIAQDPGIPRCDGLLMANSLHFVADKLSLLGHLKTYLQPGGCILIVEYDTDSANQWVPYPISCRNLQQLVKSSGLGSLQKLAATTSQYQSGGIYSAMIID